MEFLISWRVNIGHIRIKILNIIKKFFWDIYSVINDKILTKINADKKPPDVITPYNLLACLVLNEDDNERQNKNAIVEIWKSTKI